MIIQPALRLQWRHNHDFWFSDVRYQFLRPRRHIEERLTLIIDFYHLLRRSGEAFDKRTSRSVPMWPDSTARYMRPRLLLGPAKWEGHEWTWAIMAHIVASITVFVNALPLYLPPESTPLQTQGLPRCLVPLPREWRPTGHVFWHLHVLPQ